MARLRMLVSRLLDLVLRRSRNERLSEEIQAHLDLLVQTHISNGLSPTEARLAARKSFGGVDRITGAYRDQRGFRVLDELLMDVRHASRVFVRERSLTTAVVVALGLGIGVSGTMLSILYSMNVRPPPFHRVGQLVAIARENTHSLGGRITLPVFDAWRTSTRSLVAISAEVQSPLNLGDDLRAADRVSGMTISHRTFAVLGVTPLLGRDFLAGDDQRGAPAVIILSHQLWRERYADETSVIGRAVRVNGENATIIGVMPEGFAYPVETQVWRPLSALPVASSASAAPVAVRVIGRLADGVSREEARAELATIVSTLDGLTETDRNRATIVMPFNEAFVGPTWQPIPTMLLASSFMVLLIACSHAASLLVARSSARAHEMAMRAALGASRARVVRQLLVESVLLALLAGVLGSTIAWFGMRWFAAETTGFGMPYWTTFGFDLPLLALISMLCLLTGVAFGLLPALHLSRGVPGARLSGTSRFDKVGPRTRRTTTVLLTGELALTVVLLASAGTLLQAASVVSREDQAVDLANLWELSLHLPAAKYGNEAQRSAFYTELDSILMSLPSVRSGALAGGTPFVWSETRTVRTGRERAPQTEALRAVRRVTIGDRYFETLGLRMINGRTLGRADAGSTPSAALVNQRFVDEFLSGAEPIGQQLSLIDEGRADAAVERVTIVGVAPPLRHAVAASVTPVIYVSLMSQAPAAASIVVRGEPAQFADALRERVRAVDPDQPLFRLRSLEAASYMSRWVQRSSSTGLSLLAVAATILSTLGLYSLTSYASNQRMHEVGVRLALGARQSQVTWLFLRRALLQVGIGLSLGVVGAFAVGGALRVVLVGFDSSQPMMIAGVCLLLAGIGIAAGLLPARRASRLDAMAVLRQQ